MSNQNKIYCDEFKDLILKHFSFLKKEHGYRIKFLMRTGRFNTDCVFGMEKRGKPKFLFGGEFGKHVAVAAPTVKYAALDYGYYPSWFFIDRLDNYLSGMERIIRDSDEIPDYDEVLGSLAEKSRRLFPEINEIFSSEESVNKWRQGYDEWFDRGTEEWKRRMRKKKDT